MGFDHESINLPMEARIPPRVNYMVYNYTSINLFKKKKKQHFCLIIRSHNLNAQKKDSTTYVTNTKHLLFNLNKNQGHKNCDRGP